jgi:O-succinylbenzoate synthase
VALAVTLRWRAVRWRYAPGEFAAGLASDVGAAGAQRECVIVEARGADGALGLGEAAPLPGRSRDAIADVVRALELVRELEVRDAGDVSRIAREVASPAARFAVETALLGVLSRGEAGAARAVTMAVVVADADAARRAYAAGARCLKLKVGRGDAAKVEQIAAAAPGALLRLDANRAWPAREVAARFEALRGLPIEFVEEPCAELAQLIGTRLALPIALDESLADADAATLDSLLAWPAVGALVVKPTILGGGARCRELAARVAVPAIVSHALEGPIGTAACVALARAIGGTHAHGVGAHPALAGWRAGFHDLDAAVAAAP